MSNIKISKRISWEAIGLEWRRCSTM